MLFSENTLKWATRFYPPLFFQRIWVQKIHADYKGVDVKINKSLLNINYNRAIFGGTIFSAADPFYPLLLDHIFEKKGLKVRVWLKSAEIKYLKPGRTNLYFTIQLTDQEINEAEHALNTVGKFIKAYPVEILNDEGEVCASIINEIYIRNLYKGEKHSTIAY